MGQVKVSFLGVTTMFRNLRSLTPPPGVPPGTVIPPNRVVVAKVPPNLNIEPHIARLQLVAPSVDFHGQEPPHRIPDRHATFDLKGAQLWITNAVGPGLSGNMSCLFSLRAHCSEPLTGPALPVYVENTEAVQAWFDVDHGTGAGFFLLTEQPCNPLTQVPSIGVITMETNGDPELAYREFGTGQMFHMTLHSDAERPVPDINVMNFAFGKAFKDDPNDFLLNYQLIDPLVPWTSVNIPTENVCNQPSGRYDVNPPFMCGDAGPGCSTTQFP